MCGRQSVPGFIPELTGKRRGSDLRATARGPGPRSWPNAGILQLGLNAISQLHVNDGLVLPVPDIGFVPDLADVDGITKQRVDLTARERSTALGPPRFEVMPL